MRAIHILSWLLVSAHGSIAAAQTWTAPQPELDLRGARRPVIMPEGGTVWIGGTPPISWLLDLSYLDHRGGALSDAYDDGFGTRIGWNSLLSPWGSANTFWTGGFEYQNWNCNRFNANAPGNNFAPDGDGNLYGGFVGLGIENSTNFGLAILNDIEFFYFARANVGVGGMHQGFRQQAFDPTLPIFVVNDATPQSNSAYVSGLFSTGVGVSNYYSSLAFVLSYQHLQSSIITDRSSNAQSLVYGLQGTIIVDSFYRQPPVLGRVPYINRLFRNAGVGRETNSLQMMVTPRIIIQEEAE